MRRNHFLTILLVIFTFIFILSPVSAIEKCRLVDLKEYKFIPDKSIYEPEEDVSLEVKLKNYEEKLYNLTLFTILEDVFWNCIADREACSQEDPMSPSRNKIYIEAKPIAVDNVTVLGDLPDDITIRVTGKTPKFPREEDLTFMRVRLEREGKTQCEILNLKKKVISEIVSTVLSCLEMASGKISLAESAILDARLKGLDVADPTKILESAKVFYNNANDTYVEEGVTDKNNKTILQNCNQASILADDAYARVTGIKGGAEFYGFITGTVVPAILIAVIIILLFMFLRRGRWDRL